LQKVINGAKISNWACVNFCEDLSKKAIEEFCFKLAEMSRIIGAVICLFTILFNVSGPNCIVYHFSLQFQDFANLKLPIFTARSDEVEHDICIYGYPIVTELLTEICAGYIWLPN
jgi:eukaryotic translation initiation factor 2C